MTQIELRRALPREENPRSEKKKVENRKIFVGGLPKELQLEEFRKYFARYGDIVDVAIIEDKVTGEPRGTLALIRLRVHLLQDC